MQQTFTHSQPVVSTYTHLPQPMVDHSGMAIALDGCVSHGRNTGCPALREGSVGPLTGSITRLTGRLGARRSGCPSSQDSRGTAEGASGRVASFSAICAVVGLNGAHQRLGRRGIMSAVGRSAKAPRMPGKGSKRQVGTHHDCAV